jgi:hypothetical protein
VNETFRSRLPIVAGVALLVWVFAVAHAVGTLRVARSAQSRNAARAASLAQLGPDLERLQSHGALSAKLIEHAGSATVFEFGRWLAAAHPTVPAPVLRTESEVNGTLWTCLTINAEWPNIPLEAFARVVASAEALDPPVRLAAVTLDPLAGTGSAKIAAVFETITAIASEQ